MLLFIALRDWLGVDLFQFEWFFFFFFATDLHICYSLNVVEICLLWIILERIKYCINLSDSCGNFKFLLYSSIIYIYCYNSVFEIHPLIRKQTVFHLQYIFLIVSFGDSNMIAIKIEVLQEWTCYQEDKMMIMKYCFIINWLGHWKRKRQILPASIVFKLTGNLFN